MQKTLVSVCPLFRGFHGNWTRKIKRSQNISMPPINPQHNMQFNCWLKCAQTSYVRCVLIDSETNQVSQPTTVHRPLWICWKPVVFQMWRRAGLSEAAGCSAILYWLWHRQQVERVNWSWKSQLATNSNAATNYNHNLSTVQHHTTTRMTFS